MRLGFVHRQSLLLQREDCQGPAHAPELTFQAHKQDNKVWCGTMMFTGDKLTEVVEALNGINQRHIALPPFFVDEPAHHLVPRQLQSVCRP
jgi:hypothetical protein